MLKPYEKLTKTGKIRRLRKLALNVLEQYDLQVESVKFLTIETNTMFQVRTRAGGRYVLRIYSDEETTLRENQAEIFWLKALVLDSDLNVTEPIARRDGDYITVGSVPGVPAGRRSVLFKWVPGRTLDNYLSPVNYFKFGQALAKLHDHAAALNPLPSTIQPKKWDKVFYYPGEEAIYNTPPYSHLFSPELLELLDKVIVQADELFEKLFAETGDLILIHGDLHYWNVHLYRGELYLLDFEDINLGYPVQDIAVSLYYGRQCDDYETLRLAFKDGYNSVRQWPVQDARDLEILMAARSVNFINYVARIDPAPEAYIERRCEELRSFLES